MLKTAIIALSCIHAYVHLRSISITTAGSCEGSPAQSSRDPSSSPEPKPLEELHLDPLDVGRRCPRLQRGGLWKHQKPGRQQPRYKEKEWRCHEGFRSRHRGQLWKLREHGTRRALPPPYKVTPLLTLEKGTRRARRQPQPSECLLEAGSEEEPESSKALVHCGLVDGW